MEMADKRVEMAEAKAKDAGKKQAKRRLHKWGKGDRPWCDKCVRCGAVRKGVIDGFSRAFDPVALLAKRWCDGDDPP